MMVLIKLVCVSTSTMFVGDAADILVGFALVIPAGLIYDRHRTFRGALLALAVGSVISTALAVLLNRYVLVPAYVYLMFGGSWDPILGMMTPLFPDCTQENFYSLYLWAAVLPFNLLRCLVAALVTLPVYKHISRAINRLNAKLTPKKKASDTSNRYATALTILGFAVAILVLVFFAVLSGLSDISGLTGIPLAFAAGTFMYVALCDILPEAFHRKKQDLQSFGLVILGIAIVLAITIIFPHTH